MMKRVMKNLILFLASVGITYLVYAVMMWLLDKGSQFLGRESALGNIFEKLLFWLSHLGLGLIIFPILVVLMFFLLKKIWGNIQIPP